MPSIADKARGPMTKAVATPMYKDQIDYLRKAADSEHISVSRYIRNLIDADMAARIQAGD